MATVAFSEAKAKLSELLDRVEAGETVSITRHGRPAAKLVPEERVYQPIDMELARRSRARGKRYIDPDGLNFVERMRRDDRF